MRTIASVVSVALLMQACAYHSKIEDAYRVDPVLKHESKTNTITCPDLPLPSTTTADEEKDRQARNPLPCPLNLDTWSFAPETNQTMHDAMADSGKVSPPAGTATAYQLLEQCELASIQILEKESIFDLYRSAIENRIAAQASYDKASKAWKKAGDAHEKADKELKALKPGATPEEKRKREQALEAAQDGVNKANDDLTKPTAALEVANLRQSLIDKRLKGSGSDKLNLGVPELCRMLRNSLQDEILNRSQQICKKHLADTSATSAFVNSSLGIASVAFGTISTVLTGTTAKTNLAALGTGTTATQNLINKEVYRDYIVPAILRQIDTVREAKLKEIQGDQSKNVRSYSVSKAISSAVEYHEICSFSNGLILLSAGDEKRTPPRPEELSKQIEANNDLIEKFQKSIHLSDEADAGGKQFTRSSDSEIAIVNRTIERLRNENDALAIRLSISKRVQSF